MELDSSLEKEVNKLKIKMIELESTLKLLNNQIDFLKNNLIK